MTSLSSFASNYIKHFPSEIDNQNIATFNNMVLFNINKSYPNLCVLGIEDSENAISNDLETPYLFYTTSFALVSTSTYFKSMSEADKDYIPMFSWTNFFLAVLRLNNKVIFNPTKRKT